MPRPLTAVVLTLSAVSAMAATVGSLAIAGGGDRPVKARKEPGSVVARGQEPATVKLIGGDPRDGAALEVTARPVKGDDSLPPYLVGVFVSGDKSGKSAPKLLGSFSFYPARAGEAQTFVIPKPPGGDTWPDKDQTLSIKLIPANPAGDIKDAAVEILGARVVK